MNQEQYGQMSVAELRTLAKERKLTGISALKKSELIETLLNTDADHAEQKQHHEDQAVAAGQPAAQPQDHAPHPHTEQMQDRENAQRRSAPRQDGVTSPRRNMQRQEGEIQRQNMRRQDGTMQPRRTMQRQDTAGAPRQSMQRQEGAAASRQDRTAQNIPTPQLAAPRPVVVEERNDRPPVDLAALDSGETAGGVLEIMADGYGFLRSNQYLSGENDIYVAPSQIRRFNLRTGDYITGNTRIPGASEKYRALLYLREINGMKPSDAMQRPQFENMTPVFPDHRIRLERDGKGNAMRIMDLIAPVGRGQRGMIVSPPKAGKTTLLKDVARSILANEPDMHIMIMLIDERPEEVTDIREAIVGSNVEVLASTFDEQPEHHMKVAEMGIERAKRLVEYGKHVTILLDSITRLARAYNLTVQPSGRTLSGGLDPAALHMPKRFFGAARNMREGGSLTILATALVDTGSKMDDVVYEEFKGTGNMELVLDRKLSERRVFPAIDIQKSGTRREDLLLNPSEQEGVYIMRKALNGAKSDEAVENILNMFTRTENNRELIERVRRQRYI